MIMLLSWKFNFFVIMFPLVKDQKLVMPLQKFCTVSISAIYFSTKNWLCTVWKLSLTLFYMFLQVYTCMYHSLHILSILMYFHVYHLQMQLWIKFVLYVFVLVMCECKCICVLLHLLWLAFLFNNYNALMYVCVCIELW